MKLLVVAILIPFVLLAQVQRELPQDTLATVGNSIITAKDFLERFELMPWPKKDVKARIELTKEEFLYSMIAEKLLSLEAQSKNIGNDSSARDLQYSLERMFVRDALYKQNVLPRITISPQELQFGLSRYAYELEIEIYGIINKSEGDLLYKKISSSKNPSALISKFRDSLFIVLDTVKIGFGSVDKEIENAAYSLSVGKISRPIQSVVYGNWIMIRVLNKYTNEEYARLSTPDQIHKVQTIITRQKEDSIATKLFAAITSPQQAEAKPRLFYQIADTLYRLMVRDSVSLLLKNRYVMPKELIDEAYFSLRSIADSQFISIASGGMTVREVILGLKNNYVVFPDLEISRFYAILNNNFKTVIQNELLAREGMKQNLQHTETVHHDIRTWMDNHFSTALLMKVLDTVDVTETDILGEYQKDPTIYGATVIVSLQEILVDSIPQALNIRSRLNAGEDFAQLAKKYSQRKEWGSKGGYSGPIDISRYGDLGLIVLPQPLDTIIGPYRVNNGLTIFRVIDKKVIDDSVRMHFDDVRTAIIKKLLPQKRQERVSTFIGTLARHYGVQVNIPALRNVSTTTTSMYTWRHLGFGGRIVAVPTVLPQTGWVDQWRNELQLHQ